MTSSTGRTDYHVHHPKRPETIAELIRAFSDLKTFPKAPGIVGDFAGLLHRIGYGEVSSTNQKIIGLGQQIATACDVGFGYLMFDFGVGMTFGSL